MAEKREEKKPPKKSSDLSLAAKLGIAAAVSVGVGIVAIVAAPVVVAAAGFGAGGVVAGSTAASMMSAAAVANGGAIAAGSTVAVLQSVGAAGLTAASAAAVGGTATAASAGIAGPITALFHNLQKRKEKSTFRKKFQGYPEIAKSLDRAAYLIDGERYSEAVNVLSKARESLVRGAAGPNATDLERIACIELELDLLQMLIESTRRCGNEDESLSYERRRESLRHCLATLNHANSRPADPTPSHSSSSSGSMSSAPADSIPQSPYRPSGTSSSSSSSSSSLSMDTNHTIDCATQRRRVLFSTPNAVGDSLILRRSLQPMSLTKKALITVSILGDVPKEIVNMFAGPVAAGGEKLYRIVMRNQTSIKNFLSGAWKLTTTKDGFLTTALSGIDGFKDTAGLAEVAPLVASAVAPLPLLIASSICSTVAKACQQVQFRQLQRSIDASIDLAELACTIPLVAKLNAGIKLCETFLERLQFISCGVTLNDRLFQLSMKAEEILSEAFLWLQETRKHAEQASESSLSPDEQKQLIHRLKVFWRIWIDANKLRIFVAYLEAYKESFYSGDSPNEDYKRHLIEEYHRAVNDLAQTPEQLNLLRNSVKRLCDASDQSWVNKIDNFWNRHVRKEEPIFQGWDQWQESQQEVMTRLLSDASEGSLSLESGSSSSSSSPSIESGDVEMEERGFYLKYDERTQKASILYLDDTEE